MARLTLPEPADALWKTAARSLDRLLERLPGPKPAYRIGGGTILATRWKHRGSTDIDLSVPDGSGLKVVKGAHRTVTEKEMAAVGAERISLTDRHFVFEFRRGIVEITESDPRPSKGTARTECGGWTVDALSTTQILRGKLERSLKHEPPARDLFDIVAARRSDPASLEGAINMLTAEERRIVEKRWENSEYRVDLEARYAIRDIDPDIRRCTRNLCGRAVEAMNDSVYTDVRIEKDERGFRITTETRRGTRTESVPESELDDRLEETGLKTHLEN